MSLRGGSGEVALESQSGDVSADDVASENVVGRDAVGRRGPRLPRPAAQMVDASDDLGRRPHRGAGRRRATTSSLDTGSGDEQIGVRTDPDSPRKIRARTTSGDATVGYGN